MSTPMMRRARVRFLRDRVRVNFWFTPLVMSLAAVLLAWALLRADAGIPNESLWISRVVLIGGVAETRAFLINVGSTVFLTAGVVFTLITVPLSTMAAQYGSRLIRLFMGDRTTQFVLGMFVSTVVYCWAVAESLPLADENWEMPQLALTAAVLLLLASFGSLILLAQHLNTMIQAPTIVAKAGAELRDAVRSLAPAERRGGPVAETAGPTAPEPAAESRAVHAVKAGYVQYIDHDRLFAVAADTDVVVALQTTTGRFLCTGAVVARVLPAERADVGVEAAVRRAVRVGDRRSPAQDVAYAVSLLTETAARALSENDTYTAKMCLDCLGQGLVLYLRQGEPASRLRDRHGRLRLVLEPATFDELVGAAFDRLRHAGRDDAPFLLHLLGVIAAVGREVASPEHRRALLRQVSLVREEARAGDLIDEDRASICRSADLLEAALPCPG